MLEDTQTGSRHLERQADKQVEAKQLCRQSFRRVEINSLNQTDTLYRQTDREAARQTDRN